MMKGRLSRCESVRIWQWNGEPKEFTLVGEHGAQNPCVATGVPRKGLKSNEMTGLRRAVEEGWMRYSEKPLVGLIKEGETTLCAKNAHRLNDDGAIAE
jgi:hypothetical protein